MLEKLAKKRYVATYCEIIDTRWGEEYIQMQVWEECPESDEEYRQRLIDYDIPISDIIGIND